MALLSYGTSELSSKTSADTGAVHIVADRFLLCGVWAPMSPPLKLLPSLSVPQTRRRTEQQRSLHPCPPPAMAHFKLPSITSRISGSRISNMIPHAIQAPHPLFGSTKASSSSCVFPDSETPKNTIMKSRHHGKGFAPRTLRSAMSCEDVERLEVSALAGARSSSLLTYNRQ